MTSSAGREAAVDEDGLARRIGHGRSGTVRIGVTPAIGPGTLEEVASVLREQAPDTSVAFQELRPDAIPQLLRDRTVGLVLCRTIAPAPGIDSAALRPSAVELIVPAGHRLAGAGSVRLADLDAGAVALLPEGWPPGRQNVRVPLADDVGLPLRVLWPAGLPTPAVKRLRAAMGV